MTETVSLEPCPFCGGTRAYVQNAGWKANTFVCCPDCDTSLSVGSGPRPHEDSVAAWNRRTPATALASAEARIAELTEALADCIKIAEDHGRDAGDVAARGFRTSEERAARNTARSIASAIAAIRKGLTP